MEEKKVNYNDIGGPVSGNPGPQTNPRQTTPGPVSIQENFAQEVPSSLASNTVVASSPQVSTRPPAPVSPAEAQPFLRCPSAMKCVPRINCDFNGVMVNTKVFLSPIQEKQRVPLIVSKNSNKITKTNRSLPQPCVNSARGNNVDVCCRDPNYKDPWPEMETKKTQDQPNIAINQRVSSPDQALINGVPAAGGPGGYGR